jgi:hypothetical protein
LSAATLTHGFGLLLGVILMVRGGLGGLYYSDRFLGRRKSLPVRWGRIYLILGSFLIAVELAYFFFDIDWFHV